MNFEQLRDRVEALVKLGAWSNTSPLPNYAYLVNEGLRQFTQRAHHNIEDGTLLTEADTAEYQIADPAELEPGWLLLFDDATYGTSARLYLATEQQIRRSNPLWKHAASATPSRLWLANQNTIRLYAPPSVAGDTVYFRGVRHEPLLTDNEQSPLVSEYYHEAIALYGAWSWGKTHARGDELQVLDRFLAEANQKADDCKQQHAQADTEVFTRRTRRVPTDYVFL